MLSSGARRAQKLAARLARDVGGQEEKVDADKAKRSFFINRSPRTSRRRTSSTGITETDVTSMKLSIPKSRRKMFSATTTGSDGNKTFHPTDLTKDLNDSKYGLVGTPITTNPCRRRGLQLVLGFHRGWTEPAQSAIPSDP